MRRFSLTLAVLLGAASAQAQLPAGPEFLVNTYTPYPQREAAVSFDGRGDFVVVWQTFGLDGQSSDVAARRFDRGGSPRGAEFVANLTTTLSQELPAVAAARDGSFVVAWTGADSISDQNVFARWFDRAGVPRGGDVRVNTYTTSRQAHPAVSVDADGDAVVVWESFDQDGSGQGVFGQRFGRDGTRRGGEFRVNAYTFGEQRGQAVASDEAGSFVVVWSGGPGNEIVGQRFDAAGTPVGAQLLVNVSPVGNSLDPAIAMGGDGSFVVAWTRLHYLSTDVFARRFDSTGSPIGAEFAVNSYTTGRQWRPAVSADDAGNFVVAWNSEGQDGDQGGVFGQMFSAAGARRGSEFRVNTATAGTQYADRAASGMDRNGNFAVAWSGPGDGASDGIFAQRFGGLHPAALVVDPRVTTPTSDGNGVLEPGEGVELWTGWLNSTTGHLAPIYGQPSDWQFPGTSGSVLFRAVYDIPPGSVGTCLANFPLGCLTASVDAPAARPTTHWDGAFRETLGPTPDGINHRWILHLGDSFTDVPRASGFYRFVETVLHHGVTAGCAPAAYCPAGPASREQMAVFVLVAAEGIGYVPPACGTPLFADVPASSPFCRWIEELSRRGVVSGCGGGNYCPGHPVTREQMAVFVLRAKEPALVPPPCAAPVFSDVPASSPFCRWIEELARRGVVSGCGGGNYCPAAGVSREQMAVFIAATFGLQLYGP